MITKRELLSLLADVKDDEEVCFAYSDDQGELIASKIFFNRRQVDRSYLVLVVTFKDGRKVECSYSYTDSYAPELFKFISIHEKANSWHEVVERTTKKAEFKTITGYDFDDVQNVERVMKERIEEGKAVIELD